MATAAQAAGTTLSKVTRAKKQLRNAGMSEEAITALGNDPENIASKHICLPIWYGLEDEIVKKVCDEM